MNPNHRPATAAKMLMTMCLFGLAAGCSPWQAEDEWTRNHKRARKARHAARERLNTKQTHEDDEPTWFRNLHAGDQADARPENDDYARLFSLREQIAELSEKLVAEIVREVGPGDAAHVATLHRVYSTGQFLRELDLWAREPTGGDLVSEETRAKIAGLLDRWQECEQMIVLLAREGK